MTFFESTISKRGLIGFPAPTAGFRKQEKSKNSKIVEFYKSTYNF